MAAQHPNSVTLESCIIRKFDNKAKVCKEREITPDMVASFDFMESITSPFTSGQLLLSDSKDFMNELPIEGGEEVQISFKHTFDEDAIKYNLRVYKVAGRVLNGKKQVYSLMLVSEEAIINESVKIQEQLDGNPESLTIKLLREKLLSNKEVFSEPSRFLVRMLPSNMRPFDVIAKLIKKSVSSKTTYTGSRESGSPEKSEQQIKGSAGFFFWETRRGFNFFSVDALCDVSDDGTFIFKDKKTGNKEAKARLQTQAWGPYKEVIGNIETVEDARFNISSFNFSGEIDIMSSLRLGKYSTKMVFFNHSTGAYEEYVYKLKESYDNMAHLGGQESVSLVPNNEKGELSDYPTRVMTMILDHESWFNEPGIANPEDPNATDPNKFADWQKYYTAQGIARAELLRNQEGEIKIPGNPLICAGDKIDIRIASKLASELRKTKPYDEESSGVYLIKKVIHIFNFTDGNDGTCKTTLELFRDSYGVKDLPSSHGDK